MPQNPLDKIQANYESLTKTDKEIARYLTSNPQNIITNSSEFVAKETHSSKAALSRFCRRIGYNSYSELKIDVGRFLVGHSKESTSEQSPLSSITSIYASYIQKIADSVTEEELVRVASEIVKAKRVKILGLNRSFNTANQFKQRLSKLGFDSEAINDKEVMLDLPGILTCDDVALIISTRDNTRNYQSIIEQIKETNCKILFITAADNLPYKQLCDYYIVLPRISKNSSLSFLDDQPVFMVFMEVLLDYIAKTVI